MSNVCIRREVFAACNDEPSRFTHQSCPTSVYDTKSLFGPWFHKPELAILGVNETSQISNYTLPNRTLGAYQYYAPLKCTRVSE